MTILDEDNKKIYHTKNDSIYKPYLVRLKNNRYAALKPLKNKFMWLDEILKSFSQTELKEYILIHINSNDTNDSNNSNNTNDTNDLNDTNDTNNSNDINDSNDWNDIHNTNDLNDTNNTND